MTRNLASAMVPEMSPTAPLPKPVPMMGVAENLATVQQRIRDATRASNRAADAVSLVAVAKTHPAEAVGAAILAGQRIFGENRVQEAQGKYPDLKARHPDLRLHLIGPLQTNKVKEAVGLFDVIESLDRPKLAEALARERDRSGRCPELLIEVNIGEEPQKAGIPPLEADAFIEDCRTRLALPVTGLMCVPPAHEEPSPYFALLREIGRRNALPVLSMGMSSDFEIAIRLGATHVRVGTAIFGTRPSREEPVTAP